MIQAIKVCPECELDDNCKKKDSEGSKQTIDEKAGGIASLLSVARCSNGKTYGETYGFPEYSHEESTVICKISDLQDPTSKGYKRFMEECNKYLSAMERR